MISIDDVTKPEHISVLMDKYIVTCRGEKYFVVAVKEVDEHNNDLLSFYMTKHNHGYTAFMLGIQLIAYNEMLPEVRESFFFAQIPAWVQTYEKNLRRLTSSK